MATAQQKIAPTFGAALRLLRRRARMTQRDLGVAIGYTESQICRFERGAKPPDLPTIVALFVPALGIADASRDVAQLLELVAGARGDDLHGVRVTSEPALSAQHNTVTVEVPAPATALVGRTQELAQLCTALAGPVRLLTVSGSPGVGKTRLAIAVAQQLGGHFSGGAVFVTLAALESVEQFVDAVASALHIHPQDGQASSTLIAMTLRERSILLVLDNFEHLLDAAPLVSEWLQRAPGLKVLATSRVVLRLSGEHELNLAPLDLPSIAPLPPLAQLRDMPAVQLFVQRAQAVNARFRLDADNALPVAALCVRLEGLPLAIELAAVRSRMLAPAALLSEFVRDDRARLKLLTRNAKDVAPRHTSLRSAIAWSVDRLDAAQRRAFALLSILPTDSPLDAALTVTAADIDTLEGLREHSLIQIEQPAGQTRIRMLDSLRDYARERLAAGDDVSELEQLAAHARLLAWCDVLAGPVSRQQAHVLQNTLDFDRFKREQPLLFAALAWCEKNDPGHGLRLACAASHMCYRLADYSTGRSWLRRFVDAPVGDAMCRAAALHNLGLLEERCGAFRDSFPYLSRARDLYESLGETLEVANTNVRLADIYFLNVGQPELAEALCREALPLFEALADDTGLAWLYGVLGRSCVGRHATADIEHFFALSVAHAARSTDRHAQAWFFCVAGDFDLGFGHIARAEERLLQGLRHARAIGNTAAEVYALLRLLSVLRTRHAVDEGVVLAQKAIDVASRCTVLGYVVQMAALMVLWLMPGRSDAARLALLGGAMSVYPNVLDRLPTADATALRAWLSGCEQTLGPQRLQDLLRPADACEYSHLIAAIRATLSSASAAS